jgi:hypothetical protein
MYRREELDDEILACRMELEAMGYMGSDSKVPKSFVAARLKKAMAAMEPLIGYLESNRNSDFRTLIEKLHASLSSLYVKRIPLMAETVEDKVLITANKMMIDIKQACDAFVEKNISGDFGTLNPVLKLISTQMEKFSQLPEADRKKTIEIGETLQIMGETLRDGAYPKKDPFPYIKKIGTAIADQLSEDDLKQ